MNVNVKNAGLVETLVFPLSRPVSVVPGKHTVLSDALVGVDGTHPILPAIRRVYDLVCLRIIYDNALGIQVGERKKENKRGCEREATPCRRAKGINISQH